MDKGIRILHRGFYTTVQDDGRKGYAHLGVPESGAVDKAAYQLANKLLNNSQNEAVLECTLVGPTIEFQQDVHFVITGAIMSATLDGEKVMMGIPIFAKAKQVLMSSKIAEGTRAYIAFAGGLKTEVVLGSRSWYQTITPHSIVSNGMYLEIGRSTYGMLKGARLRPRVINFSPLEIQNIKASRGPEYGRLSEKEKIALQETVFTVSTLWNRMAVQLEELFTNKLKSIRTSPVIPGTVQLTPSGKLILLLQDCQTTGGYPRVLLLTQEGLNKVAQMQQGNRLLLTIT